MKKVLAMICVAMLFCACSDPKIDASNEAKIKVSIEKVRAALPEDKKAEFDDALLIVSFAGVDNQFAGIFGGKQPSEKEMFKDMQKALDKKTANDIIAQAKQIKRENLQKEITELETKKAQSDSSEQELAKVLITNAKFYKEKSYFSEEPVIEFTIQNTTGKTIAKASFSGVIKDPTREVPYFEDTFSYAFPGGLQDKEKKSLKLAPNMFGPWGKATSPKGAVFTIKAIKAYDAKDNILWDASFSKEDLKKLEELKAQLAEIK